MKVFKVGFRKYIINMNTKNEKDLSKISNLIRKVFPKITFAFIGGDL